MPKHAIRSRSLDRRRTLDPASYQALSVRAQEQLLVAREFITAGTVGLYSPVRGEVDTSLLCRTLQETGRSPVFPRVVGEHLEFVRITGTDALTRGSFGVLEPEGEDRVDMRGIDLLVVPGVAFDRRGHRLGYGKGYYDRALQEDDSRPLLAGLAFAFQLVERLPAQPHDVQLQMLATETGLLRF